MFLASASGIAFSYENSLRDQYCHDGASWPAAVSEENLKFDDIASLSTLQRQITRQEKAQLGKKLFFDPRLSSSNQISCASCHNPQLGWADGSRVAIGHDRRQGHRNTMGLFNVAYFEPLFWDGRAKNLHQQALMPVEDPKEMNETLESMLDKLNDIKGYKRDFEEIYATKTEQYTIKKEEVSDALTVFMKTISSRPTRFDQFVEGDCSKLTDQEIVGMHLFRTKARCITCHSGALFTDNQFHNTGLSYFGRRLEDLGRFEATGKVEDMGKFRTPSLRELKHTGPYMHNGLFPNLRGIVNMYNAGMGVGRSYREGEPKISELIKPLNLTLEERKALEDFLLALSNETSRYVQPPGLYELGE